MAGAALLLLVGCGSAPSPLPKASKAITIAVSQLTASAPVYVANARGYFSAEGLNVTLQEHTTGRAALAAMVDQRAQYATCAETSFMTSRLNNEPVSIIATLCTSSFNSCILTAKNGPIRSVQDLKGKRVAVPVGTIGEFVLDTALLYHHLKATDVERVNSAPEKLISLFDTGAADAMASWDPHARQAIKASGDRLRKLPGVSQCMWHWSLVATEETLKDTATAAAVLRALQRATEDLNKDKKIMHDCGWALSRKDVEESDATFQLILPQSLILSLEAQVDWARERGYAKSAAQTNVLEWIHTQALDSVDSSAVRIIR